MSTYSSREPFNDDPEPYRNTLRGGRQAVRYGLGLERFEPRPEYDRPQNNPTNPILVARRNNPGENIYYRDLERWPTEAEKDHARKVLTRLAALKENA